MKYGKKLMAAILSAAMVASMSMSAFAAETPDDGEITAPILSFDVVDVVVPTKYAMVFNPEKRAVTVDAGTQNDQIVARNFGILNKSSKDKVVTVNLTVDSQNGGKVTFVEDEASLSNNALGDYRIYLTAIPADGTEVTVGTGAGTPADKNTDGAALSKAVMTKATEEVVMKEGKNALAFKLDKAVWDVKVGETIDLDSVSQNSIAGKMDITSLAASGKGITAFTFSGKMDENAAWDTLTEQIKITAKYDIKAVTGDEVAVTGTGAMVEAEDDVLTLENGVLTARIQIADFKSGTLQIGDAVAELNTRAGAWGGVDDAVTFTFNSTWADAMKGKTCVVTVVLQDGSEINASFNVPN